ncbi:hypothetical protein OCU04_002149 [Sclerotinia nivalis]|uniref:Uncharacterized protein n=1 Tax=Sclerotinia nivalis TaxID=352851 RepID=A0A9X0DQ55_9HELO|nr:hypothetical protein OCU04_002149 [Sclerotinia nivalis]
MASYTPGEKAYLLHLCAVYGITGIRYAPYNSWPRLIEDIIAEAPRHLEGGDLFDGDPWPVRRYALSNISRVCRHLLSIGHVPMRNADVGAREDGVDMGRMRVGFVLNEQPEPPANFEADNAIPPPPHIGLPGPEPPANIEPGNGTPPPPHIRPPSPQLPSLRDVLSSPNNHPQPILDMNSRLVARPRQPDERHRLPDGPVKREPDAT